MGARPQCSKKGVFVSMRATEVIQMVASGAAAFLGPPVGGVQRGAERCICESLPRGQG